MTGLIFFVAISIFLIAMIPHINKKFYLTQKGRIKGEAKAAEKEAKANAKWMKNYGERAKGRRVGLVYKKGGGEYKQEFTDVFAASEALNYPAKNIWAKANLGRIYTEEPKDSFEIVKYKFYWIHK